MSRSYNQSSLDIAISLIKREKKYRFKLAPNKVWPVFAVWTRIPLNKGARKFGSLWETKRPSNCDRILAFFASPNTNAIIFQWAPLTPVLSSANILKLDWRSV